MSELGPFDCKQTKRNDADAGRAWKLRLSSEYDIESLRNP